jgi:CheY-like chemotaxis protein
VIFEPQSILLVDNDPAQASLIREVLQAERVSNNVQIVPNGPETIAYLTGTGKYRDRSAFPLPCFLLLDLKVDGAFEVLSWIRNQLELRRMPVVVLTHSRDLEHVTRVYALGANSYLVKPFDQAKLRELVKAINAYWVILVQKPTFG